VTAPVQVNGVQRGIVVLPPAPLPNAFTLRHRPEGRYRGEPPPQGVRNRPSDPELLL